MATRAVGRHQGKLTESLAAMRTGEIGFGHVALMASTAEALVETAPAVPFEERPLLRLAKLHLLNRFRQDCAHERHAPASVRSCGASWRSAAIASFDWLPPRTEA